jgi:hypothetical protein
MKAPHGGAKEKEAGSTSIVARPRPPQPPPPHLVPPHLLPLPLSLPHRDSHLLDLVDDLLLLIMASLDPLPDLFSLRRTCRRFAELGRAQELSLLVVGVEDSSSSPSPSLLLQRHRARACFPTLAEAVAAARPGDTVRVSATSGRNRSAENKTRDDAHALSAPVAIAAPLLIRGCGLHPEETVLRGSFSSSVSSSSATEAAALCFSASAAVLENLSVETCGGGNVSRCCRSSSSCSSFSSSSATAAVLHSRGALTISRCSLVGRAGALAHLHSPLVTSAVGGLSSGRKARNVLRVEETRISRRRVERKSGKSGSSSSSSLVSGGPAVRTSGTGVLSSVRALPLPCGGALLWCEVDADKGAAAASTTSGNEGEEEFFFDALPTAEEVKKAAAAATVAALAASSPLN